MRGNMESYYPDNGSANKGNISFVDGLHPNNTSDTHTHTHVFCHNTKQKNVIKISVSRHVVIVLNL